MKVPEIRCTRRCEFSLIVFAVMEIQIAEGNTNLTRTCSGQLLSSGW
jgi:hypothetical protein